MDSCTGRASSIIVSIPLVVGSDKNNTITFKSLSQKLGYKVDFINEKVIRDALFMFLNEYNSILDIKIKEIGEIRISNPAENLWQVFMTRQVEGIIVRDSSIVATINNGNLVLFGLNRWGDIKISTKPRISKEEAIMLTLDYIGNKEIEYIREPRLEIIPISLNWYDDIEASYSHKLAWVITFRVRDYYNTWEIIIDAKEGEIISFQDLNNYITKKIMGAVYPLSGDECCPEGCAAAKTPIPYTDTGFSAPNDYTDLGGLYDYSSGTVVSTFSGKYINVNDNCGSINESSTSGDIDLGGINGEHDCIVPAGHSAGDTFASRMAITELSLINRIAHGWVNYPWLDAAQTVNTNLPADCNAFIGPGI